MKSDDLREEVNIEIELIENILKELSSLCDDLADREPTTRGKSRSCSLPVSILQWYRKYSQTHKQISFCFSPSW